MTKPYKVFKSKPFLTAKAIALAVFPIILLALPATHFDKGKSLCLFTLLSDIECYGCGMTRACMHLIHLDFSGAAKFNMISFVVLPILCFLYAKEFRDTIQNFSFYNRYFSKSK